MSAGRMAAADGKQERRQFTPAQSGCLGALALLLVLLLVFCSLPFVLPRTRWGRGLIIAQPIHP